MGQWAFRNWTVFRVCCPVFLALSCTTAQAQPELREGDLIFQSSRSAQSQAIQLATHSPYSHMGMIFTRNGAPHVFEASATVRYTPFAEWIARGEGAHFVIKRLRDADSQLTAASLKKLRKQAKTLEGKPYDVFFEWSDQRIYCSELVWKIYWRALGVKIGELQKIREFDLSSPPVQAKLRERYGNRIPMDEPVISPAAIFGSPVLEEIGRQ
ncbi:MAG: YiiX family permuted papain-like enzyme [Azoarcus sp.]|nr:YiiX family permuted papain-like enzyme [Azoarcus sp.]